MYFTFVKTLEYALHAHASFRACNYAFRAHNTQSFGSKPGNMSLGNYKDFGSSGATRIRLQPYPTGLLKLLRNDVVSAKSQVISLINKVQEHLKMTRKRDLAKELLNAENSNRNFPYQSSHTVNQARSRTLVLGQQFFHQLMTCLERFRHTFCTDPKAHRALCPNCLLHSSARRSRSPIVF